MLGKINQSALARQTGLTQPQISNYLSGKVEPRMAALVRLADAMGLDPAHLAMVLLTRRLQRLGQG